MREGILVERSLPGGRGVGEAAPFPSLSSESVDDVAAAIVADGEAPPSLLWALFCAARPFTVAKEVSSCALLWPVDEADFTSSLARLAKLAPKTVKLKIGRGADDVGRVRAVRHAIPGVALRLDGNRRLQPSDVRALYEAIGPIEYFEEPCADFSALCTLAAELPIAIDESCGVVTAKEAERFAALVIKPSVIGPAQTHRLLAMHEKVVISSVFESAFGRNHLMHLARPGICHGLDTRLPADFDVTENIESCGVPL